MSKFEKQTIVSEILYRVWDPIFAGDEGSRDSIGLPADEYESYLELISDCQSEIELQNRLVVLESEYFGSTSKTAQIRAARAAQQIWVIFSMRELLK